jgi:2-oxoisovalerate dehydrogenase E2 component (dihydrolipoyl transacylase)
VQSDKATVEITSRYKGHVTKLYHETGDMAQTGEPLCDIELEGEDGGDEDAPPAEVAAPAAVPAPAAPVATVSEEAPELAVVTSGKVLTTPAVRRMAREFNLDLAAVALTATGKNGRIMKEDVIAFMEAPAAPPARVVVAAAAPTTGPAVATPPPVRPTEYLNVPADRVEPVSAMTKVMIRTMTAANNVPHFTYGDEMRLDRLVSLRKSLLPAAEARGGGKLR